MHASWDVLGGSGAGAQLSSPCCMVAGDSAHAGMGSQFGTRDPPRAPPISRRRADRSDANVAGYYVGCYYEFYDEHNGELYLTEMTPLQVSAPRPFNLDTDPSAADSDYPVQDISAAQFVTYTCEPLNGSNDGANCHVADARNAAGFCYRKRDRNWECVLNPDPTRFQQSEGAGPTD